MAMANAQGFYRVDNGMGGFDWYGPDGNIAYGYNPANAPATTMPTISQQAAFDAWNPSLYGQGLTPDLLNGINNAGWMTDPRADLSSRAGVASFTRDPNTSEIMYHPQGQGPGEDFYVYDGNTGKFLRNEKGSKVQSYASGIASVLASAAAMGALGATAGGAAGGATGVGGAGAVAPSTGGTFGAGGLGTGSATGGSYGLGTTLGGAAPYTYGGQILYTTPYDWAAAAGAGGAVGGAAGAGLGGGGSPAAPAASGGSSFLDTIKSGASSMFGGSGGSGGGFNWSSLVGPATSLAGGYLNSKAASDAADAQRQAAEQAAALSEPWRAAGQNALNRMQELLGVGGNSGASDYGSLSKPFTFTNDDPSYQWRLDQGLKGVKNAYAAKGGFLSGGAMKGINDYAQGAASQEYQNAFNRDMATKTNQFNRLASLSGNGQTAANTIGEYGTQAGNASAAGTVGSANAMNNALTGAWNSYTSNELLNKLLQR